MKAISTTSAIGSAILTVLALLMPSAAADDPAGKLYSALERRLQSLKSLEIRYVANSPDGSGQMVEGRIVWVRPDRFYHETPEWTLCELGREQWRFLKAQNTLIRELTSENSEWLPETVLFNMTEEFRPVAVEAQNEKRVLTLESRRESLNGLAKLVFPKSVDIPDGLELWLPDGNTVRYHFVQWEENESADDGLFAPPPVPAENIIDFRGAGGARRE